ncbi:MAG: hypothetical protein WA635_12545, partial [Gallionella sp.]
VISIFISGYSFAGNQDKTSLCLEGLKNDGRFSSIANHLVLDGQDTASPQMLADETRPDELQLSAIAELIDARSECVNLSPNHVSISLHMTFLGLVQDLYNGKITFGEFNKKWHLLFEEITNAPGKMLDHPSTHQHH